MKRYPVYENLYNHFHDDIEYIHGAFQYFWLGSCVSLAVYNPSYVIFDLESNARSKQLIELRCPSGALNFYLCATFGEYHLGEIRAVLCFCFIISRFEDAIA